MPSRQEKAMKIDHLRYTEYYDMQKVFDELYEKATKGEIFDSLMDIILSRENIHQFFSYSICFILSWVYNGFGKSAISVIIIKKKKNRTQQIYF